AADMNLDSVPDIVVATRGIGALGEDKILVFRQDRERGFLPADAVARIHDPAALETLDLDNDQRPDLLVLNRATNSVQVLLNRTLFPNTYPPRIGSIPDLQLILGQPLPFAFNLDKYVLDDDTPHHRLHWSVEISGDCPTILIHSDNDVEVEAPTQTGNAGRALFTVSDGIHQATDKIVVNVVPAKPK
ncbi:MAG: VCBS repeat-containing protein, partial [bacterium]